LAPQAPDGNLSSRKSRHLPGTLGQAFEPMRVKLRRVSEGHWQYESLKRCLGWAFQ
jgi:hypothetical protein